VRFLANPPLPNSVDFWRIAPWIALTTIIVFSAYGLYDDSVYSLSEYRWSIISAAIVIHFAGAAISFMVRSFAVPRTVFVIAFILFIPVALAWRRFCRWAEDRNRPVGKLIMVGTADGFAHLVPVLRPTFPVVFEVLWPHESGQREEALLELTTLLQSPGLQAVLIEAGIPHEDKRRIISLAVSCDTPVLVGPDFFDLTMLNASPFKIREVPFLGVRPIRLDPVRALSKRTLDLSIAVPALLFSLPVMALIALAIKLDSSGPVLYRQERVGQNHRRFHVLKFRTMVVNAEMVTGPVLSSGKCDLRVTRVGRIMRQIRMDELPQLFNIVKGEMSLVGPRPERPFFVEQFERQIPEYCYRHKVPVGLTGLAQVLGRYSSSPKEKLQYDLLYARNTSMWVDIRILFLTVRALLMKESSM
jgi:exopolysaccharide biosynthesis polyprenyl glycosylphosphotransferase